jgi:hypothetical protein
MTYYRYNLDKVLSEVMTGIEPTGNGGGLARLRKAHADPAEDGKGRRK